MAVTVERCEACGADFGRVWVAPALGCDVCRGRRAEVLAYTARRAAELAAELAALPGLPRARRVDVGDGNALYLSLHTSLHTDVKHE